LIQGDCYDIISTFKRKEFKLIVTDPPYGLHIAKYGRVGGDNLAKATYYDKSKWDKYPLTGMIFKEFQRISENQVIFGGNYFPFLPTSSCWLVWDKKRGTTPDLNADCELIWTSFKKKPARLFHHLWRGFLRDSEKGERYHPTQKPIKLLEWIIKNYCDKDDVILDPFIGSGTTMIACQNLKRSCIGIEINPKYCEIVKKRCFGRRFLDREVEYRFEVA
jgi:DNA modification methylase